MVAAVILFAGCSNLSFKPKEASMAGMIRLMWDMDSGISEDQFALELLREQFPDVEFKLTEVRRQYHHFANFTVSPNFYEIAQKNSPSDLIMYESTMAPYLIESGYLEPLDAYIAADTSLHEAFDPALMEAIRQQGGGQIYGLPLGKNVYGLYYNKDFFHELNLPVPTDGMTWDEVFELSRMINEHPGRGDRLPLAILDYDLYGSQLHARFTDQASGNITLDESIFTRITDYYHELAEIQKGSEYAESAYVRFAYNRIFMVAGRYMGTKNGVASRTVEGFQPARAQWDIASFPVIADVPDTGPAPAYYYLGIAKNSGRKDDVFRVLSYLLSEQVQTVNSQRGLASARSNPDMNSSFGALNEQLIDKQVSAFFRHPREGSFDPNYDFNIQDSIRGLARYYHAYGSSELFREQYREELIEMLNIRQKELTKTPEEN